jgi:thioredoxin type arsenate reductase
MFSPLSGAHFNPVVTLVMAYRKEIELRRVWYYLVCQFTGAVAGVSASNLMFELAPFSLSKHARTGSAQFFSEVVATFGLLMVILMCSRFRKDAIAYAVAMYITAAYWFTASTSFANPAVTVARALTDTFAGIRPLDVPAFVIAQGLGAVLAVGLAGSMFSMFVEEGNVMKKRVLFLCTGNSARSQMAEGLLRSIGGDKYEVFSAGTHPKGVHPMTIAAMQELGIDIGRQTSKDLDRFLGQDFDYVITVCDRARQACPVFPGATPIHWGFDDPAEATGSAESQLRTFRQVRDEIRTRLRLFVLADKT